MERMCKSILRYNLCGHTKEFERPCRENVGSDGRRCSEANMHTTRQTTNKWPCEICRILSESRRERKRKRADDDSANVIPNGMGTLQGDINKDVQVKSVDEPTRQDRSGVIRHRLHKHRLPIGSSFLAQPNQPLKNYRFDYDAKDDINKDLQVKSVDEPTRQERSNSILAEEPLKDIQMPLPQMPLPQMPLPQMPLPLMPLPLMPLPLMPLPQMPLPQIPFPQMPPAHCFRCHSPIPTDAIGLLPGLASAHEKRMQFIKKHRSDYDEDYNEDHDEKTIFRNTSEPAAQPILHDKKTWVARP
ncbi:hypothetical protein E4U40_005144 [Claviceps sp. LM458 group G5]|nr:hypothetical protein E4U40_005144 [Claviceps sp. LM458 group G5]